MKINNQMLIQRIKSEAFNYVQINGVKGWNMAMLASKTGVSKDTLYRIFPSKEQLLRDILIDGILEYQKLVENIAADSRPYPELLPLIVEHFAAFAARLSTENVQAVLLEYPSIEEEFSCSQNSYFKAVADFLEKGRHIGYFKPDLDVGFLIKIINAYTMHFLKITPAPALKNDLNMLAAYLLEGIVDQKYSLNY